MFLERAIDTGLTWPRGRGNLRKTTDHIQIHHTVGVYGTPAKWAALHKREQGKGNRGVPYSYLVLQDGSIYLGRGLEYSHGGAKDSLTNNANQRSVAIALDGDMRKDALPTEAQLASAVALTKDIMERYGLPPALVLGHNELPVKSGGTYPTACPCMDMGAFRELLEEVDLPSPAPPQYPTYATYGGGTYVNLRDAPGGTVIGRVAKGERVVVLTVRRTDRDWAEVIALGDAPLRGWCVMEWMEV